MKLNYVNNFHNWHVRTQIRELDVHGRMVEAVKLLSELKRSKFYIFLTVHLRIVLVRDQLDARFLL